MFVIKEGKIPIKLAESLMTYLMIGSRACSSYNAIMEGLGGVKYAKREFGDMTIGCCVTVKFQNGGCQ